jgi:hypothetical protein
MKEGGRDLEGRPEARREGFGRKEERIRKDGRREGAHGRAQSLIINKLAGLTSLLGRAVAARQGGPAPRRRAPQALDA